MATHEFVLDGDYIALNRLLKLTGACPSGGSAKRVIAAGAVNVDGTVETRKTRKIRTGQTVTFDGTSIRVVATASDTAD